LELLDQGWNLTRTASAVGTYPREVRRVGWPYVESGLEAALSDDPRPKPAKMLDAKTAGCNRSNGMGAPTRRLARGGPPSPKAARARPSC
jgi:hypothetical protein